MNDDPKSLRTKDEEILVCEAEEDGWACTLEAGHEGPHEAWGLDCLMCRWWSHGRLPREDLWRERLVQDLESDR